MLCDHLSHNNHDAILCVDLRGEPFEVGDDELMAQGSTNIALGF